MNPLEYMFPKNKDNFVETVLIEMDIQIEFGKNIWIIDWNDDDDNEGYWITI